MTASAVATRFQLQVTSKAELREIFGQPAERVIRKQISALDGHCRDFIAKSPFLLLATSNSNGTCDVSPKGDGPGFVTILDDKTIVIPDRKGNKRIDSFLNIVDNPHVGLLFLIPGVNETLRVNGSAIVVQDEALLNTMIVEGARPQVATVVTVEEAFLHCPKSFMRSNLWDTAGYVDRATLPTLSRMVADHGRPAGRTDEEHERIIAEAELAIVESLKCLY